MMEKVLLKHIKCWKIIQFHSSYGKNIISIEWENLIQNSDEKWENSCVWTNKLSQFPKMNNDFDVYNLLNSMNVIFDQRITKFYSILNWKSPQKIDKCCFTVSAIWKLVYKPHNCFLFSCTSLSLFVWLFGTVRLI